MLAVAQAAIAGFRYAARMPEPRSLDPLPIDAVSVPPGHRDVRREVFAAIPAKPAPLRKRLMWGVLLRVLRVPGVPAVLQRFRSR
jgi:hypothetical protein